MFSSNEIISILTWWTVWLTIGIIFFPLTNYIFNNFLDRGYIFSKVLGIGIVSYLILVLNILHILPFNVLSIFLILWICAIANFVIFKKIQQVNKLPLKIILTEEALFLVGICVWSFIRAHEPSINGLEKFMDFGFVNSILRTSYLPPADMWFPPLPINYYYFGHLTTAVITKLSMLPSTITYNLMIATLFSFCFSLSFSIGANIVSTGFFAKKFLAGIITGSLVTFAGNLHTIYTFFKPYNVDHPVPFWSLQFLFSSFPNNYWYPNATRFIPLTIHEFPIYSFVVSDLHGHVIDIPFVLLTIALCFVLIQNPKIKTQSASWRTKSKIFNFIPKLFTFNFSLLTLLAFMLAIMYMTNVWDGVIYMLLVMMVVVIKNWQEFKNLKTVVTETLSSASIIFLLFIVFTLPFNIFFKPFASGIGILCAPSFLTKIGKLGPFIFEANHCQHSPWWQLITLYGFFYFFVASFLFFILRYKKIKLEKQDMFVALLIGLSTLLIIIPEFIYVKDIYPAHYRANTMFKLVYQAFIMLSISSGYIIFRITTAMKRSLFRKLFIIFSLLFLILVMIYPYFAVKSYYGELRNYSGIDGLTYLKTRFPQDYNAINWINNNITGQPIIVEAQGDSYTDYARISSNTGLPTILGWTVHEWLWRGTYDIPAPRIKEVKDIYESKDYELTKNLFKKHKAEYVYVGDLEHQKYPNLIESKFEQLGKVVWEENGTRIYKINN